jgi:hypothetical protein
MALPLRFRRRSANPISTTVTRILCFGPTWTVKLACGCTRRGLTSQDLDREQLFIGKTVACDKH